MFSTNQEEPEVSAANFQVESNKLISTKAMTETLQRDISIVHVRLQNILQITDAHMWYVFGFNYYARGCLFSLGKSPIKHTF